MDFFVGREEDVEVMKWIPRAITHVTPWATGRCNLRCRYCFIYRLYPQQPSSDMPEDVWKALVEFLWRESKDVQRPNIWWFGGEPLVAFSTVVKPCWEYAYEKGYTDYNPYQKEGKAITWGVTTNATLLTQSVPDIEESDIAEWMVRRNFGFLLSIDGTKRTHDMNRVYPDGRGSFDDAWKGVERLMELNAGFQIRWSVAPNQVKYLFEDLEWYIDRGIYSIAPDPVYEVDWDEEALNEFRNQMRLIRENILDWWKEGKRVILKPVRDGLELALLFENRITRREWRSRCGLAQGGIGVDVNGDIYPCFVRDTFVVTKDGVKTIDNVRVGDYVLTHTGSYRKVTETMRRHYRGKLYVVRPFLLPEIRCTPEHPFYVKIGNEYRWVSAKDLSELYVGKRIGNGARPEDIPYLVVKFNNEVEDVDVIRLNELFDDLYYNSKTDTVVVPGSRSVVRNTIPVDDSFLEFIGWFIAEGSLAERDAYIGFAFSIDEEDVAVRIKEYLEWLGCTVSVYRDEEHHRISLETYSRVLYKLLDFLVGRGAHNKRIHPMLKCLPPEKQKVLVLAIFKGDGTWYRKEAIFSTVSRQLAFDVYEILLRIGVVPKFKAYTRKRSYKDEIFTEYRVFVYGCEKYDIMQGKRQVGRAYVDTKRGEAYFPILKITTEDYDGYVYNLEVETDNSYTANLVVVHNCHRFVSSRAVKLGNVKTGWDTRARIEWIKNWIKYPPYSEEGVERCRKCIARGTCFGGCLAVNYDMFGDPHIMPKAYCDLKEILIEVFSPLYFEAKRRGMHDFIKAYMGVRY